MASNINKQLPGGADTVNEEFFDALVRHQIGLMRLSGGISKELKRILDATEQDMAAQIRRILGRHKGLNTPADLRRQQTLLKALKATRLPAWEDITPKWLKELREVATMEVDFMDGALKTVVPVVLETTLPSAALLNTIARSAPFEGNTLREWAASMRTSDLRRIEDQIKIGMVQGESSAAIARRVVGTRSQNGRNGVTEITRRQAEGVTRTAVNGIANQVKREFYKANETVFTSELYVATLDARTTPICRSLDGKTFPVGEGPIPPLHFNCRSLRVGVIDGNVLGSRPSKPTTEKGLLREYSKGRPFAPPQTRAGLPRGEKGKFDQFSRTEIRKETGTVPAKVSYQEWLGRQSAAFQNDVLGKTKGALFRRGDLPLDRFVNRAGDELTLSQLARTDAAAFRAAGLDPEDFL